MIVNKQSHVFMGTELKIGYAQGSRPSLAGHIPRLSLSSAPHSTDGGAPTASLSPTVPPSSSATHSTGGGATTIAGLPATAVSLPLNYPPAVSTASISGHSPGASEAGQPDTTSNREMEEALQTNSELTSQLYHDDRLMVGSMPSEWNDEALGIEIEDILDISEGEYKVELLSKHYTEQGTHTCMCRRVHDVVIMTVH